MGDMAPEQRSAALIEIFAAHGEHPWEKVGRCVYCGPCGVRLYQGTLPDGHPVYQRPRERRPTPSDAMRDRWGK